MLWGRTRRAFRTNGAVSLKRNGDVSGFIRLKFWLIVDKQTRIPAAAMLFDASTGDPALDRELTSWLSQTDTSRDQPGRRVPLSDIVEKLKDFPLNCFSSDEVHRARGPIVCPMIRHRHRNNVLQLFMKPLCVQCSPLFRYPGELFQTEGSLGVGLTTSGTGRNTSSIPWTLARQ
jgi:hypothetical protein